MRKEVWGSFILVILYVLLGNARSIQENPFIPGAVIAVSMIVPVIAGILFGKRMGAAVGFVGTLLNAIVHVFMGHPSALFEFAAIIPHTIMGFFAGYYREKWGTVFLSLSLIVGHVLNIIVFLLFSLITFAALSSMDFWYGLLYEIFVGVIAVVIIVSIYRLGFESWN